MVGRSRCTFDLDGAPSGKGVHVLLAHLWYGIIPEVDTCSCVVCAYVCVFATVSFFLSSQQHGAAIRQPHHRLLFATNQNRVPKNVRLTIPSGQPDGANVAHRIRKRTAAKTLARCAPRHKKTPDRQPCSSSSQGEPTEDLQTTAGPCTKTWRERRGGVRKGTASMRMRPTP